MGDFLTTASTMMCPHGGTVSAVAASGAVRYGGDPVVVDSDTFTVGGCPFAPSAPHPCVSVEWMVAAARSTAGGAHKLTTDSVGMCKAADGAIQGPVMISATQTTAGGL